MANVQALFINSDGNLEQVGAGDVLEVDEIDQFSTADLTIGRTVTGDIILGNPAGGSSGTGDVYVKADLYVDNDLYVTGSSAITVDETVTGTFNANGNVNLGNNSGDTINLGGGTSDTVNLNADLTVGNNVIGIGSSATDAVDELWLSSVVGGAGTGINLNATGNGTSGSEAIGVYITGFVNFTPGASDLQSVLEAIDTAIGSGGATLQTAYAAGNTISVTTGNGAIQFSNTTDATNVLELSRTFAGAGSALTVSMGASTTGIGMDIGSTAGASGNLVDIDNAGDGNAINLVNSGGGVGLFLNNTSTTANALQVQDGGGNVMVVDQNGAVSITPTSGQNLTLTAAGAGTIPISAAGAITIDSSGAGISIDAAGASNFSTSSGNLTLDAAAGELVLDDVGNSSLTLSQASDRTLDTAGVLSGATSIIGSLNALADEIDNVGVEQFVEVTLDTGVTAAAGDALAYSSAGTVKLADADGDANAKKFVGIARTGGTATTITMWTPGALVTGTGYTAGSALFVSTTPGALTTTAPTTATFLRQRVGWAISTTQFVLDPGPPVIL